MLWTTGAIAGALAVGLTAAASVRASDTTIAVPCSLDPGPSGTVARIVDGETLALDDGSLVRLIGTLAPRARDAGAEDGMWPAENEAIKALTDLVLGKKVKLAFGGRRSDRYGHVLAHVFLDGNGDWVQGALLDQGHARVYGLPESFACMAELVAHEDVARRQRVGLWSNGAYRAQPAERPEWLMALRGKYERVAGRIVSVGRTKSATYLNFGSDYKTDFTARIGKTVLAANANFAAGLDALKGKTIVVRGWIERNNGPLIDVEDASQIEAIEPDNSPAVAGAGVDAAPAGEAPTAEDATKKVRPAPAEGPAPGGLNL